MDTLGCVDNVSISEEERFIALQNTYRKLGRDERMKVSAFRNVLKECVPGIGDNSALDIIASIGLLLSGSTNYIEG